MQGRAALAPVARPPSSRLSMPPTLGPSTSCHCMAAYEHMLTRCLPHVLLGGLDCTSCPALDSRSTLPWRSPCVEQESSSCPRVIASSGHPLLKGRRPIARLVVAGLSSEVAARPVPRPSRFRPTTGRYRCAHTCLRDSVVGSTSYSPHPSPHLLLTLPLCS